MGLQLDEIQPLPGLTREETREAARRLSAFERYNFLSDEYRFVSEEIVAAIFSQNFPHCRLSDPAIELHQAEWLIPLAHDHHPRHYALTEKAQHIAYATTGPRMSFKEACAQICAVRERLQNMPVDNDGFYLKNVYLFGSTLRDSTGNIGIGDLDLLLDVGFGKRHQNLQRTNQTRLAKSIFKRIIGGNDDRINTYAIRDWADRLTQIAADPATETKTFVLQRIWHRNIPVHSDLTLGHKYAIQHIERRTMATQQRACAISKMIRQADIANRPSTLFSKATKALHLA